MSPWRNPPMEVLHRKPVGRGTIRSTRPARQPSGMRWNWPGPAGLWKGDESDGTGSGDISGGTLEAGYLPVAALARILSGRDVPLSKSPYGSPRPGLAKNVHKPGNRTPPPTGLRTCGTGQKKSGGMGERAAAPQGVSGPDRKHAQGHLREPCGVGRGRGREADPGCPAVLFPNGPVELVALA